jgi:hypothetical protein
MCFWVEPSQGEEGLGGGDEGDVVVPAAPGLAAPRRDVIGATHTRVEAVGSVADDAQQLFWMPNSML